MSRLKRDDNRTELWIAKGREKNEKERNSWAATVLEQDGNKTRAARRWSGGWGPVYIRAQVQHRNEDDSSIKEAQPQAGAMQGR